MGFSSFLCGSTIILQFTSDHSAEFIQTLWEALAYSVQLLRTQPPPHPNSLHTTTLLLRMWPLKTAWTFAVRSKMALCRSFAVDQSLPLSAPPSLRRWASHIIVFGLKRNTHTHRHTQTHTHKEEEEEEDRNCSPWTVSSRSLSRDPELKAPQQQQTKQKKKNGKKSGQSYFMHSLLPQALEKIAGLGGQNKS